MAIGTPTLMGTGGLTNTSTTQSTTITTSVGAAIGDHVFIACAAGGNGSFSINDTRGNTYSSMNARLYVATLTTAIQAGDVIAVTTAQTASSMSCVAFKTSGLGVPVTTDKNSTPTSGTSTTPQCGATGTTTVANELVIGELSISNLLAVTVTPDSGWSKFTGNIHGSTGATIVPLYQIVSSTGTYTPSVVLSGSKSWDGRASTFAIIGVPVNSVAPVASGTGTVGQTLSCTTGTWSNTTGITYAYQWQRDAVNIGGATSSTYLLVSGDGGKTVRCVVTATNGGGAGTAANSNGIAVDSEATDVTPTFTGGLPRSGQALVLSTAAAGSQRGGFNRTSSGALAATTTTTGMTWQGGFMRRPITAGYPWGPLVYELNGTVAYIQNGLGRTSNGALAVTTSTSNITKSSGMWRDSSKRLVVAINTTT